MYPHGSSENHQTVGRVGGYGVFFVDERDVTELCDRAAAL